MYAATADRSRRNGLANVQAADNGTQSRKCTSARRRKTTLREACSATAILPQAKADP